MKIRSFRVPFSKVVGDDATELEFGPDDYLVVRPLFGLPAAEIMELSERMTSATSETADALIEEVLKAAILEWHLADEAGTAIEKPTTGAELRALPGAIAGSLYPFLAEFRGDANPTTRG